VPVDTDPKGECGGTSCKFGIETVAACNGAGACYQLGFSCQPYTCGESGCLTACTSDKDCSSTAWCNAGKCQTLKETGQTCPSADACKSGLCEQGVCCSTSCAAPFSCDSGTCTCGGQICPAGDQCIAWYEDKDGDGFGNPKKHKQGCSSFAEPGWSKLGTDCFDTNANARPGQTLRFLTDRGDGSFDFDCDGVESQAYPAVINPNACKVCGACVGECAGKVGFDCNAVPYCPSANVGFSQYTACGSKGTLYECNGSEWSNTCLATFTAKPSATQTCR